MIQIKIFVFNAFQENTFVLYDETKECIIVDPGCYNQKEKKVLSDFIDKDQLVPKAIVNTHGHVDHVLGCKYIIEKYKIPFYLHNDEMPIFEKVNEFGAFFGLEVETPPMPDFFLHEGDEFAFGNSKLMVSHVPGHSPGSISLYSINDNFVITGDVLFNGSIGRTDLPAGDFDTLIESIRSKLLILPRKVAVYPGHGPDTTIGKEIDSNPFL